MSYRDNIKMLDKEGLGAMKNFLAHTLFALQEFVQDNKENVPLEDWEYEKVIRMVKSGALQQ
jgi:hypothetical protein|tara:strand:- start:295 stop:480 length:186 start_codon:yes stop_codon:yes gene_type:complete